MDQTEYDFEQPARILGLQQDQDLEHIEVQTDADSEIIASLLAGFHSRLGNRLFLEFALRADQHFADWKLTDRVSGRTGSIDDYLAYGGYLGVGFRF